MYLFYVKMQMICNWNNNFLQALLNMFNVKTVMPQLTSILEEASLPKDPNFYRTGFWGRAQV